MKAFLIKLPFPREIDNSSEDVSYETLQEICEKLNITPVEIPNDKINVVSINNINFVSDSTFIGNLDYVMYLDEDNSWYIYEYDGSPQIVNRNNELITTHNFVLSNWYTYEVYMYRNALNDENLMTYVWNCHANRWVYDKSKSEYPLYPDYLQQFYLTSPNTSVITKNIHQKDFANTETPDSSICNFLWNTNMDFIGSGMISSIVGDTFRTTYNNDRNNTTMKFGLNYNWSEYYEDTPEWHVYNQTSKKDILVYLAQNFDTGTLSIGECLPKAWADTWDGSEHNITWDMIDDFYSVVDSNGNKSWRYAIIPIATQLTSKYTSATNLNQILTDYWVYGQDEQIQLPGLANQGAIILLPVIDAEVEFYEKQVSFNTSTSPNPLQIQDTGNIKVLRVDTLAAWQAVWADISTNYNAQPNSIITYLKPSQIYKKYISESYADGSVNWLNNYFNGTEITGGMHNIGPMALGDEAGSKPSPITIERETFYYASILNYFLLDLSQASKVFTDLQNSDIKFFKDFKDYLDRINGKGVYAGVIKDLSIKYQNEPLIKQPIYFNVRYGIKTGSEGVLYPDMIDWEHLWDSSYSNGIDINSVNTDRTIYCWDLTNNVNPLFDFSATWEPLQFSDDRQYINSTAWTAYQSSAYTAMASQFNTQAGQTTNNMANSLIGTGLTFFDGMNEMRKGNNAAEIAKNTMLGKGKVLKGTGDLIGSAITAGFNVANQELTLRNINNQRAAMLASPANSGTNLPFSANVLPASIPAFWTSYMVDSYANTLSFYHQANGYIHYTNKYFHELENRVHFNYIKLDTSYNKKIITRAMRNTSGAYYPAIFNQLPFIEIFLAKLQQGLRVHHVLNEFRFYDNVPHQLGQLWHMDDLDNIEKDFIPLLNDFELLGDYTDWHIIIPNYDYRLVGDYTDWELTVPNYDYLLQGDFSDIELIVSSYDYHLEGDFSEMDLTIQDYSYYILQGDTSTWTLEIS